jgi:urease accessory protein
VATVVLAAPDAECALDAGRAALDGIPVESGVSAWNGMLVARLLAADSGSLRRAVIAALHVLRAGRPLPRVWLC